METFTYDQIFEKLVKSAYAGNMAEEIQRLNPNNEERIANLIKYASGQGEKNKVIFKAGNCSETCTEKDCAESTCQVACLFNAIVRDEEGNVVIKDDYCLDCGECVKVCKHDNLVDKKEFIPLIELLKDRTVPVYAIVAPAFIGQFGSEVTPGKLRAALKRLGFYGMLEVALFADVLTLKEALEFDIHVQKEDDFVLTSCCCPMWWGMIKKVYTQLVPHISPSVSPMVACGRSIKKLHPDAKVVFIGPCIAKKAEAKEPEVSDAVDVVLTFQEMQQIFQALNINPAEMPESESDHSSRAGRIYARTGGVSKAVADTVARIRPERTIPLKAVQADGVPACKKLLQDALEGRIEANFYEGMGCVGGCVGGPKVIIDKEQGKDYVNRYGDEAESLTPADNEHVLGLLKSIGFDEIDELLEGEKSQMFKRSF